LAYYIFLRSLPFTNQIHQIWTLHTALSGV
jgi:hypothetical protein